MSVKAEQILALLDNIAPFALAEEWDNVGLLAGSRETEVKTVLCALDLTEKVLDEALDPGLPYVECDSDERLGPDRAAADIAAIAKYGAPLVVLDFGTATTLDAVSREGVYLGGCITAGVQVSIDGLFQKTALLPRVELVKPDTVLSTTAVGQIQAGAVLGYIGAIEYLIRHAKEEIGQPDTKVVATGGLSRLVADNTELIDVVDPQLVLDGLRIIYERARR